MELSERQLKIIDIVKENEPISSKDIADKLNLSRATLRTDLAVLTMVEILNAKPKVGYYYNDESHIVRDIEKLFNLSIKNIMSMPVNVGEEVSVYDAIVKMFLEDVGTIFVIDDEKKLSGVISRKDLLKMSIGQTDLKNTPVSLAMTRRPKLITIKSDNTFFEAARKINDNKIDSLPVVDDEFKSIGRISKTNITKTIVEFEWD
ncbi:MAG TPA: helix-turn-helix transcriptional regulator [Halanaerobiales bacterium]|nr:helix-turn-helix transcriptional regulator [Halanaerobiales bacterium]